MKATHLALALLLVSCGTKSGNIRVRIADVGPGLQTQFLPVSLAQSLGYYQQEGLDVALESLPSSAKTMQALIGGSIDAASMGYSMAIQVAAEGQHVRTFFVAAQRASNVLVVAPLANKRIRRVEDLKGKVIGIPSPGNPSHLWMNYYLAAHGVSPTEVSAVGIGVGASALAAIANGRVDAAVLSGGDHIRLLRRNPSASILVDGTDPEVMRETFGGDLYANGAVGARQDWLDRNPDTVRRLARALVRTHQWIAKHSPEEIREHLPESFRSQDAAQDIEIIRWGLATYTPDGAMPKGAPEATKHFLDATIPKVRDSKIDLATTWTNEYLPAPK